MNIEPVLLHQGQPFTEFLVGDRATAVLVDPHKEFQILEVLVHIPKHRRELDIINIIVPGLFIGRSQELFGDLDSLMKGFGDTLNNLPPFAHTLVSFHNQLEGQQAGLLRIKHREELGSGILVLRGILDRKQLTQFIEIDFQRANHFVVLVDLIIGLIRLVGFPVLFFGDIIGLFDHSEHNAFVDKLVKFDFFFLIDIDSGPQFIGVVVLDAMGGQISAERRQPGFRDEGGDLRSLVVSIQLE